MDHSPDSPANLSIPRQDDASRERFLGPAAIGSLAHTPANSVTYSFCSANDGIDGLCTSLANKMTAAIGGTLPRCEPVRWQKYGNGVALNVKNIEIQLAGTLS
jgi:hypothetical protein